ncbi:unnamed protein product, partial [Ectocarpus fasciculatus]
LQSTTVADVSSLVFNFCSTILVTTINKYCFERVNFGFPAALCNIHFLVTWVGVDVMRRCGYFHRLPTVPNPLIDRSIAIMVLVLGIVTPLNNTSLKLNSIGFYQLFKNLQTPAVVVFDYFIERKTLTWTRFVALAAVCIFTMVSSHADLSFSVYGTVCAALWVPMSAIYKIQWGRVLRMHNASTLQMMYELIPWAIAVQCIVAPLVDPPGLLSFRWSKEAVFWLLVSGFAAFLVNLSGFLVMSNISALAHVLLGQLKSAAVCLGAYFVFGTVYPPLQLISATGAIIGIVAYTQLTVSKM